MTPLVALAVLVIGLISASYDGTGKDFRYTGFLKESVPTYFLAKTLFCSTALFLLGQLVAEVATLRRGRKVVRRYEGVTSEATLRADHTALADR